MAGVRRNLFPGDFVPPELFPEGICSVRNKFPGYNLFRAREFVPHPGNLFPLYLPYRTSRYFVLHAWYTVLQVVGPGLVKNYNNYSSYVACFIANDVFTLLITSSRSGGAISVVRTIIIGGDIPWMLAL